jgi:hypothetical protein
MLSQPPFRPAARYRQHADAAPGPTRCPHGHVFEPAPDGSLYDVLEVPEHADHATVRRRIRALLTQPAMTAEGRHRICRAALVLWDPGTRQVYDHMRLLWRRAGKPAGELTTGIVSCSAPTTEPAEKFWATVATVLEESVLEPGDPMLATLHAETAGGPHRCCACAAAERR